MAAGQRYERRKRPMTTPSVTFAFQSGARLAATGDD
jgi:hypothetical protein